MCSHFTQSLSHLSLLCLLLFPRHYFRQLFPLLQRMLVRFSGCDWLRSIARSWNGKFHRSRDSLWLFPMLYCLNLSHLWISFIHSSLDVFLVVFLISRAFAATLWLFLALRVRIPLLELGCLIFIACFWFACCWDLFPGLSAVFLSLVIQPCLHFLASSFKSLCQT